mgnify:CR=1 FL=1
MKATVIYGVSGSGKSTFAKSLNGGETIHVERDIIRFNDNFMNLVDWEKYSPDRNTEYIVDTLWRVQVCDAARIHKDIIISDTLCKVSDRRILNHLLKFLGYDVEFIRVDTPFEECIQRDHSRGKLSVGKDVIFKQHNSLSSYKDHL